MTASRGAAQASSTTSATGSLSLPEHTSGSAARKDDVVESPSVGSSNALARFEYESGKTRDCTKVLMVEWEDDEETRKIVGEWTISWEGKQTVLPARDGAVRGINRLYFLLPAGERVPAIVTLTLRPDKPQNDLAPVVWKANSLPAIFPPGLGASAREAGKKGVLHTLWAKRRLQVLAKEIGAESRQNTEGVAITMAIQEKEWIEQNFGVTARPAAIQIPQQKNGLSPLTAPGLNSPQSPRSPGGGRLMEKLKGLKLATAEKDLQSPTRPSTAAGEDDPDLEDNLNPLSPEQSDVAVGSFTSFAALKGMPDPSFLAAKPSQRPADAPKMRVQQPPEALAARQRQAAGGMASLDAIAGGESSVGGAVRSSSTGNEDEKEDDLFALPISPRSPDMSKSPFSFGTTDTARYMRREKA